MPTPREPLVYDVTVEAMFSRALKGRLSPRLKTRVKEEGIVGVLKLLGPKRALGRMSQTFQHANNYMQSKLEELGPGRFRLWVNEVGISPHFIAGTLSATLRTSGTTNPQVEIAEFDGHQCTYAISF